MAAPLTRPGRSSETRFKFRLLCAVCNRHDLWPELWRSEDDELVLVVARELPGDRVEHVAMVEAVDARQLDRAANGALLQLHRRRIY